MSIAFQTFLVYVSRMSNGVMVSKEVSEVFPWCYSEDSWVYLKYFKEVLLLQFCCCMAVIAATGAEGGLYRF